MLNLQACATVDLNVLDELQAVDDDAKKAEWSRQTNSVKAFKKAVMDHGMAEQDSKCVWCESKLGLEARRSAHRDHIAPKEHYRKWTFLPANIAVACEACNGFTVKSDLDTIAVEAPNYEECDFRVVHPYLDNPVEHIEFVQEEKKVVMVGLSVKGCWTIKNLQLDGTAATARRAFDRILEDNGLSNDQRELINQAMASLL
ncbi:hypothetical protein BFP76_11055 [Amylibacter kogurei]|uniref:HNH domain-containing protein n=1 Tax=Paramylibacter kogurei TaxID=1889778 RepID=A0A2G5KBP4_9RHOB|nr:hypothetical protein [Amylibacter kogurei]PIB26453.1 hypothetical protein BFP76_11055 [Amylibacter kogurei]